MDHMELVSKAELAIGMVFGDTSVSPETTKDSLENLLVIIEEKLACLEDDGVE